MKNGKIWKNIKNIHWKLIQIDNTIAKLKKQILCKLKQILNDDPIEILANFNVVLVDNKIKENYAIWKNKKKNWKIEKI